MHPRSEYYEPYNRLNAVTFYSDDMMTEQRISSSPHPQDTRSPESQSVLVVLILVLVSTLPYLSTIQNPFIWDSYDEIVENPAIRELENIPQFFTQRMTDKYTLPYYRPLQYAYYAVEYAIFGANPTGYRIVAICLNALVTVLLFQILLKIRRNIKYAAIAAVLFAVTPGRAEAVYWIYGASNILLAVFILLSLRLYIAKKYVHALLAFTAAMLSRESAVLFPFLLLLYEYAERTDSWKDRFKRIAPFALTVLVLITVRTHIVGTPPPLSSLSPQELLYSIAVIVTTFIKILYIPDGMVVHYPYIQYSALTAQVMIALVVLALSVVLGVWIYRKSRYQFFWYCWFFVWIAVWFNVGQFGSFLLTEKELYLAAAGSSVLLAHAFIRSRHAWALTIIVAVMSSTLIVVRGTYWQNAEMYYLESLKTSPRFGLLYHALGYLMTREQNYKKAIQYYEQGLEYTSNKSQIRTDMGYAYIYLSDTSNALQCWEIATSEDPSNDKAPKNMGTIYYGRGEWNESYKYYMIYLRRADRPDANVMGRIKRMELMIDKHTIH